MTVAVITLAILFAASGGTAIALALRQAGVKEEAKDDRVARKDAEEDLKSVARELVRTRGNHANQIAAIRREFVGLERDLENCDCSGAHRERLERLLSKAANRSG